MQKREELDKLTVHELRTLARDVGVKTPTTKLKEVLMDEIIKITSGEMEAVKSNMGRKPKARSSVALLDKYLTETTLAKQDYERIPEAHFCNVLSSGTGMHAINTKPFDFFGVIRSFDNSKFVKNYISGQEYICLPNATSVMFASGDVVKGTANSRDSLFAFSDKIEKVNVGCSCQGYGIFYKKFESIEQIHKTILNDEKCEYKIMVEVEATNNACINFEDKSSMFYVHTKECEDIVKTYNMLIDVKNMVKCLISEKKSFSLYLLDVEYMYEILNIYFDSKGEKGNVNAGQYFKELFSMIKTFEKARLCLFSKDKNKSNSYLDNILSKYC